MSNASETTAMGAGWKRNKDKRTTSDIEEPNNMGDAPALAKKTKGFPLLDLPAELRNRVYELALTDPDSIHIVSKLKMYRNIAYRARPSTGERMHADDPNHVALSPRLLHINKQVRNEATGILYSHTFDFADTEALANFLTMIGPSNRQRLRTLRLYGGWCGGTSTSLRNQKAMMALTGVTDLECFRSVCRLDHVVVPPEDLTHTFYRQAHFFLDVFGQAKGKRGAALNIIRFSDENFDVASHWNHRPEKIPKTSEEHKARFHRELRRLLNS